MRRKAEVTYGSLMLATALAVSLTTCLLFKLPLLWSYLLGINGSGALLMVIDKQQSRQAQRLRAPEILLFCCACLGGTLGILTSMLVCRHKTRKISFYYPLGALLMIQIYLLSSYLGN